MSDTHQNYLGDLGQLLKEMALEARRRHRDSPPGPDADFQSGVVMAYVQVISLMQSHARAFELPLGAFFIDHMGATLRRLTAVAMANAYVQLSGKVAVDTHRNTLAEVKTFFR
jgi:hypothetical protein